MAGLNIVPADWPVVSRLLDGALALPAASSAAWLTAQPESEAVKATLRRLLRSAEDAACLAGFDALPQLTLDPYPESGSDGRDAAHAGLQVGPYRLLRELGSGGMGSVWLAERVDGGLKRPVALKLPRASWTRGLAERMARERDILASLDHPHIARIHDAGLDEQGRPYLALEYVAGEPIDAHCRRLGLPTAARLLLLLQVARAVAHAHARLVVHRDLKPANILVTPEGQVRLLDFGIAKLMEGELAPETELTAFAGRALTLAYASPEQIRGEPIGTASDVYSLGVVAYELLTGSRPYQMALSGAASPAQAIGLTLVRAASTVCADAASKRALRGDLDAILNQALKQPVAERYASVDAFAQDIERHLAREPVLARADTPWYLLRRFASRHALAVGAGAAVAASLVAGSGLALWQARVARLEAARAEQVKNFALSIVSGADTEGGAGRETTAVQLLQAAKLRLQTGASTPTETAVELMTAVGMGLQSQGRSQEAADLLQQAFERATRVLGGRHPRTLAAATAYGTALLGLDRPKEAIALLRSTADEATRAGHTLERSAALRELSSAQLAAADGPAGLVSARAAVAAIESLPESAGVLPLDAFYAWAQLANALNVAHDPALVPAARRALALAQQVYGDRPTDNVLSARLLLAKGLLDQGDDREGLAALEGVYAAMVRLLGVQHPRIEAVANFLGSARADAGDVNGAVQMLRVALAAGEANAGGSGGNRGIDHYVLGRALALQHRPQEALEHFNASARLLHASIGADSIFTQRSLSAAALALARSGQIEAADRAFAALDATKWPQSERAQHAVRLAELRSLQGRHGEAVALARDAAVALRPSKSMALRAATEASLGKVLMAAGRRDDAVASLREALRLWSERQLIASPDRSEAAVLLAQALN